jgi:hypothetical protein
MLMTVRFCFIMYRIPLLPQPSGSHTNQKPLDKPEPHQLPRHLGFLGPRLEEARIEVICFVLFTKGANAAEAPRNCSLICSSVNRSFRRLHDLHPNVCVEIQTISSLTGPGPLKGENRNARHIPPCLGPGSTTEVCPKLQTYPPRLSTLCKKKRLSLFKKDMSSISICPQLGAEAQSKAIWFQL